MSGLIKFEEKRGHLSSSHKMHIPKTGVLYVNERDVHAILHVLCCDSLLFGKSNRNYRLFELLTKTTHLNKHETKIKDKGHDANCLVIVYLIESLYRVTYYCKKTATSNP